MSEEFNWVFLRSFVWPHEYYTLQAFLESYGIKINMRDEVTIMVDPLLSNAIGGIKMYVAEEDFVRAAELLAEFDKNRNESEEEKSKKD